MVGGSPKVWRNFVTLSAGETTGRLLQALGFFLLARRAGAEAFGQFGLAVSITSYAALLIQQGFDTIAVRDTARDPRRLEEYAAHILGLRAVCTIMVSASLAAYALLGSHSSTEVKLLLLLTAAYALRQIPPRWAYQALELAHPLAVSNVVTQFCFAAGVWAFVWSPADAVTAAVVQVAGEWLAATYLFAGLARRAGWFRCRFDWAVWRGLLAESWPLTASLLLANLLFNLDILALALFGRPREEIGWYAACYRCVNVFTLMVANLQISIFPSFARAYPDAVAMRGLAGRAVRVVLPLGVAFALGLALFAESLLRGVFGASFAPAADVLAILTWVAPLQALRAVFRQMLYAFHFQRADARNMLLSVSLNAILDVLLIPVYGPLGCAAAAVSAELALLILTVSSAVSRLEPVRARS